MNKKEIIEKIYNDDLDILIKKLKIPNYDKDDFKQEITLSLLEKDDNKIEELYKRGELNYFIVKMIRNSYFSKNGEFYQKYKKYYTNLDIFVNKINNDIEKIDD